MVISSLSEVIFDYTLESGQGRTSPTHTVENFSKSRLRVFIRHFTELSFYEVVIQEPS